MIKLADYLLKHLLILINGPFEGLSIEIKGKEIRIGSSLECDITLDHSSVAPEQAIIFKDDGRYILENLHPDKEILVNEKVIREAVILQAGDVITIGIFELEFNTL